jgi:hypothetical protein
MTPILKYLALASTLTIQCLAQTEAPRIGLRPEMDRLKIDTVLILKTSALDEWVLWSKDGKYVGLNVMGKWAKIDLSKVELVDAKWRSGKPLGVNIGKGSIAPASDTEIQDWLKTSKMYPRELILASGTKIELKEVELSTALVITPRGGQPNTIWVTGGENCHSLTASPTGEYFAFISEMNGAVIMLAPK